MVSAWAEPVRPVAGLAISVALALAAAVLPGCARSVQRVALKEELETGRRFVSELAFRRAALERSLAVTSNGEARSRLEHYGVADQWEALPVLDVDVAPVVAGQLPAPARFWAGEVAWSESALLELGRRAFEEWPAQRAPQLGPLLGPPAQATSRERARLAGAGVAVDDRGHIGGFVWARYRDGTTEPALSCASCHARLDGSGRLQHGPASDFDLGSLIGQGWGPGHVDVTADGLDNPVAVPDLRATRHQQRLHHSGNLYNGLGALAVRTETLLITARDGLVRPPRQIAFALAYYVWSLGAPGTAPEPSPLFRASCGRCHSGETGAGGLVAREEVGTDPAASESRLRGSGGYRAPSLYRVTERRHLTHLGWALTLEQFLAPERQSVYPGHAFGLELDAAQRQALLSELARW